MKKFKAMIVFACISAFGQARAGIPTIDGANLFENITTAIQSVLIQIDTMRSLERQIADAKSIGEGKFLESYAGDYIEGMRKYENAISGALKAYGDLDAFLEKYRDVDFYRGHPCYQQMGCNKNQIQELKAAEDASSKNLKTATDGLVRSINDQKGKLDKEAKDLKHIRGLQEFGEDAGLQKSLQSHTMLLNNLASQQLQMREMWNNYTQVVAVQTQQANDAKAQTIAAHEAYMRGGENIRQEQNPIKMWPGSKYVAPPPKN